MEYPTFDGDGFTRVEFRGNGGSVIGIERFIDGSANVYMEDDTRYTTDVFVDLVTDEFEPVQLIEFGKLLIETGQKQIDERVHE